MGSMVVNNHFAWPVFFNYRNFNRSVALSHCHFNLYLPDHQRHCISFMCLFAPVYLLVKCPNVLPISFGFWFGFYGVFRVLYI